MENTGKRPHTHLTKVLRKYSELTDVCMGEWVTVLQNCWTLCTLRIAQAE